MIKFGKLNLAVTRNLKDINKVGIIINRGNTSKLPDKLLGLLVKRKNNVTTFSRKIKVLEKIPPRRTILFKAFREMPLSFIDKINLKLINTGKTVLRAWRGKDGYFVLMKSGKFYVLKKLFLA